MKEAMLCDFHVIRPKYERSQEEILAWVAEAHTQAELLSKGWKREDPACLSFHEQIKENLLKIGVGKDKIQKRGTEIQDPMHMDWDAMPIYPLKKMPQGAGSKERSEYFDTAAMRIMEEFYPENSAIAPHLIHVTCTGYVAPSPAQKLIAKRGYGDKSIVTHAYHMGCYAAFPALRMASGFICSSNKVDIVHTEICSLHMNPLLHETEQLVVQTLFADGFIKYSLQLGKENKPYFSILSLHEETLPDSEKTMTWIAGDFGMKMTLAKEIPLLIASSIEGFLKRLSQKAGLDYQTIFQNALFAIHPGGQKIIQQAAIILKLQGKQIEHSLQVMGSYGNMSSATLPHVWKAMLEDPTSCPVGTYIVSIAFGPGLSLSGAIFKRR